MIRTKFTCSSITKSKHWDGSGRFLYTAIMQVVMNGSEDNKKFFAATPTGTISVGAFIQDAFEPGKEYFVDFTPVEQVVTFTFPGTTGNATFTTTGTDAQYKLFNTNEGKASTDKKQGV